MTIDLAIPADMMAAQPSGNGHASGNGDGHMPQVSQATLDAEAQAYYITNLKHC